MSGRKESLCAADGVGADGVVVEAPWSSSIPFVVAYLRRDPDSWTQARRQTGRTNTHPITYAPARSLILATAWFGAQSFRHRLLSGVAGLTAS